MNAMSPIIERVPPSPAAVREGEMWLQRGYLEEFAEMLRSLSVSIIEGCSRGSNIAAITHTREARTVLIDMLGVVKTLEAHDADLPEAPSRSAAAMSEINRPDDWRIIPPFDDEATTATQDSVSP